MQMTLETGEIGRQANGAVNLTYGDTVWTTLNNTVLGNVVMKPDFFRNNTGSKWHCMLLSCKPCALL